MTREKAINRLRDMINEISDYCNASKRMSEADRQDMETFDMAIKALERESCPDAIGHGTTYTSEDLQGIIKGLPSIKLQPCEDAISREDALLTLTGEWTELTDEIIHQFIKRIKSLPPVNTQPKTGHWIKGYTFPDGAYWKCDKCNELIKVKIPMRYCNNCGAKMVEPQERSGEE